MSDDPRIEAAAHVLRKYFPTAGDGLALRIAEEQLAAADRAAWRPISEAPKIGARREVWIDLRGMHVNDRSYAVFACWDGVLWRDGHGGRPFDPQPTHYREPLPATPEDSDDG